MVQRRKRLAERAASLLVVVSVTDILSEVEVDADERKRRWKEDRRGEADGFLESGDSGGGLDVNLDVAELRLSMMRATSL